MLEAIAALIGMLATIMPSIVQLLMEARQKKERESDAMVQRDIDVLHGPPTDGGVQPVQDVRTP